MIIHNFLLAQKILDIFEKGSQLKGWRRSRYFLRKYRESEIVVFKEYSDYSSISTLTESSQYFWETIVIITMLIYRKQERDMLKEKVRILREICFGQQVVSLK